MFFRIPDGSDFNNLILPVIASIFILLITDYTRISKDVRHFIKEMIFILICVALGLFTNINFLVWMLLGFFILIVIPAFRAGWQAAHPEAKIDRDSSASDETKF